MPPNDQHRNEPVVVRTMLLWATVYKLTLTTLLVLSFGTYAATQESARPSSSSDGTSEVATPSPGGSAKSLTPSEGERRSLLDSIPTDIRMLPDSSGVLHKIPANASWEGYLEYISKPRSADREQVPSYSVSSVELSGEVKDDRAILTARCVIQIRQTSDFVRVPLQFNEGTLLKREYVGTGEVLPDGKDLDQGLVYWLRGPNPHTLALTMSLPIKGQIPVRRMQLTLPASPISKLTLIVPHKSVSVSTAEASAEAIGSERKRRPEVPFNISTVEDGRSRIEVYGFGNGIDLSWQPNPDLAPSVVALEAYTSIVASIDTDAVLLEVRQRIQSLQGKFDSFTVQLPQGAELLKIEDGSPSHRLYRDRRIESGSSNRVSVFLNAPSTGPVQLKWTVRLPRQQGRHFTLDGFNVESARRQSGEIGLAPHDGLRISSVQSTEGNGVLQIKPSLELKAELAGGQLTSAYRFLNQPFRLDVAVDPIRPNYKVEPKIRLLGTSQQLILDADFEFQLHSDTLNEVTFLWPDGKTDGWTVDGFDPPEIVQSISTKEDSSDKNEKRNVPDQFLFYRVRLTPQTGPFHVRMRARRPASPNEDLTFTLPKAEAASPVTPTLILSNAENVETELKPRGETMIRPAPLNAAELPEAFRGLKSIAYRVDTTDEQSFTLRVLPQQGKMKVDSSIEAVKQASQIDVVQTIHCTASYERISDIKLVVPRSLSLDRNSLTAFTKDRNLEMTAEIIEGADSQSSRNVRLNFRTPVTGSFKIKAKYSIPFADDPNMEQDSKVVIPLLQSSEEPFTTTRVDLVRNPAFEASAVSEIWKPQPLRSDCWSWQFDGSRPEIELLLAHSPGGANGTAAVTGGLITAIIDQDGMVDFTAQFRIEARSDALIVTIPPSADFPRFYWGMKEVIGNDLREIPAGSKRFALQLPDLPPTGSSRLLTVKYKLLRAVEFGLPGTVELISPQLPQCSWDATVVWRAAVLPNQHLFTYPTTATPMFQWRRSGLFWYRISEPDSSHLDRWIKSDAGPPASRPEELDSPYQTRNLYVFSQIGAPRTLRFHTLASPMVLLFGAGTSFLFGFVLLRVQKLRHVLTVLVAGLALAIFGLKYSAPLELLMQPMIAGLVFPLVAVLVEGWFRRSSAPTILTLPTAADLAVAHGSREEVVPRSLGGDSTALRPVRREESDAIHVDSGSGVS